MNKVNGAMDEKSPDSTSLIAECENPDGSKCQEHAVIFDQEVGIVCAVCGNVLLEIENMWERDVRSSFYTAMLRCLLKC